MGIFDNQFFTCPSWGYGMLIITLLSIIIYQIAGMNKLTVTTVGLTSFIWWVWCVYKFIARDDKCARTGYTSSDHSYWNPIHRHKV